MHITRRQILVATGLAGGLVLGWTLLPHRYAPPLRAGKDEYAFDAWLKIARDGVVSVAVPDCEMGQGITTLIAQVVATELGADWRQVAIEPAPVSAAYANAPLAAHWAPLWWPLAPGLADDPEDLLARRFARNEVFVVTAEGTALAAHEAGARAAAAGARAMLARAAAARWDVGWEECEAQDGFIVHDRKRAAFAELVEEAAGYSPPDPPVLRAMPARENPAEFPDGAPLRFPRLDLPSKVDGSYTFAADVRLPDMVHAAIHHAPIGEAELLPFDPAPAKGVAGFIRLVKGKDWLAAVATDWWAADQALGRIAARFAVRDAADSARIGKALDQGLTQGDASRIVTLGDPDRWLEGKPDLVARYTIAPALHATIETASATARLAEGKAELWVASQAPQALRRAVAGALDLALEDVVLYPMPAGGSFDARLEHRHAIEAALIARELGRPVQLTWSRWQEHIAGLPRAPARALLAARTAPDGSLIALKLRLAMPATMREFGRRLFGGESPRAALGAQDGADPLALEGAVPPYGIDSLAIEHVPVAIGLPTGRLHGNAHALGAFLVETFIDELAARSGREPLSYRMAMLGSDVRLAQCLQRAASLAQWDGGRAGAGQGLACHRMTIAGREGRIGVIASARIEPGGVRVDRFSVALDIGRVVNADIARQQVEGALIFAIGLANGASTDYERGLPRAGRLGQLGLPALGQCPEIDVDFIDSQDEPFDPAELTVAAALPAVANALFSAGSVRLRSLPLTQGQG